MAGASAVGRAVIGAPEKVLRPAGSVHPPLRGGTTHRRYARWSGSGNRGRLFLRRL